MEITKVVKCKYLIWNLWTASRMRFMGVSNFEIFRSKSMSFMDSEVEI